jgi:hypothetical protein
VAREGTQVTLRVTRVHPDAGPFGDSLGFGLRLLWEPSYQNSEGPLEHAVPFEVVHNARWMAGFADGYVASVQVEPVSQDAAIYTITATEAQWTEHLAQGTTWRSAAYED